MAKQDGALRTIGEAAEALGVKPHILRYWEEQFPMLSPLKRAGGRRYYRPEDMALLQNIDRMVNRDGFTIAGARKALSRKARSEPEEAPMRFAAESDGDQAQPCGLPPHVESGLIALRGRLQRIGDIIGA